MKNLIAIALVVLSVTIVYGQKDDSPVQPDIPGDLVFDFGFNFLQNNDGLETQWFQSRSFGVYYMLTRKLNDYITVNPMIGISSEKYDWDANLNFTENDARQIVYDTIQGVSVSKNRVAVNYVELPVEIRFFPWKTIEGEGLFIGVGAMIGGRFESHTKTQYTLENGQRRQEKLRTSFGLEDVRYGVRGRIGLKGVNAFYKLYLSDLFRNSPAEQSPTAWTVGINFSGF
jgi:hypothetical protein